MRALHGELVQHAVGDEEPGTRGGEVEPGLERGSFLSVWISTSSALLVTDGP